MNAEKVFAFLDSLDNPTFTFLQDMKRKRIRGESFSLRQMEAIERCIPKPKLGIPDGAYLLDGEEILVRSTRNGTDVYCNGEKVADEIVQQLLKNPLEYSKAYGRKTGICGVCHATLTNAESIELGIGPICRGKF